VTVIAILGLGEAGRTYALDLCDAGFDVTGFDPYRQLDDARVAQMPTAQEAVAGADLAISLVGADAAEAVARQALAHCPKHAVYADLNTGLPALKRRIAKLAAAEEVEFADVAVLAPVAWQGAGTPLIASGRGAEKFAELVRPAAVPVESIPGAAGAAAERKLLRSVFMKGLAAVLLEADAAAVAAGQQAWLRTQIVNELSGDIDRLVDRLVKGSKVHAARRVHEAEDVADYLTGIGQPSWVTTAAHTWLASLLD